MAPRSGHQEVLNELLHSTAIKPVKRSKPIMNN
jgi:hypothetical protein